MSEKPIRFNLTLRVFCITFVMLLAASAMTYKILAMVTPMTYISIASAQLEEQSWNLVYNLEMSTLEESGPILDAFIVETGANVVILNENGEVVQTPSQYSITTAYENENIVLSMAPSTEEIDTLTIYPNRASGIKYTGSLNEVMDKLLNQVWSEKEAAVSGDVSITIANDPFSYWVLFEDNENAYEVRVTPPVERSNQTVEALNRALPWVLGTMLVFSALCALGYSRYITRPILRLSGISQRMANLDFSWKCEERRKDEIGVLGRNLDDLSSRLSTAMEDLRKANETLRRDIQREREMERQRTALFSAVSHELKTPLTILKGQLSGMLDRVDVYQDRDRYLAKALGTTGRMEELVQEILTVSRMEASAMAPKRQTVALGALTASRLEAVEDLTEQKRLTVRTTLPENLTVQADRALLKKAVDNLISNAVFYAPEGAWVEASLTEENGRAVLRLENSGSRIPEVALPHVFEPFYRAESSRSRRTGGSGLGLYLVQMILDLHGAAYQIENTSEGVRFTVWFAREEIGEPADAPSFRTGFLHQKHTISP